ncbi:carboxy terminal-processing peptidase, partial [Shewanella sp. 0m-11]
MRKLSLAVSIAGIFVGFSAWAVSPTIQFSELPALKQEPQHKVASKRVTGLFTRSHYHRFDMDDAFSEQVFNRYLKQLDYRKNVLLQSDIDSFKGYSSEFDDMLKSGDLNQAYKMFELVQ